jgi:DNA-binding SARP family transcriptional activator
VEFRVLGPVEAIADGRPLELGGPRQRALLALLLLNANRVVAADRLVDELWPGEPPQTARTAVRVAVSQLRKVLGADAIVTSAPGYRLAVEPEQLDLQRFERLAAQASRSLEAGRAEEARRLAQEALELWRGPALANVVQLDLARAEAGRLEELRLNVLERRIEAELALGGHVDVVAELEALVARHPLRERFARLLMLALYRSGRQADALGVYQRTRSALVDGLGIEPGESLRRLELEILRHEPSLERESAPAGERAPSMLVVLGGGKDGQLVELAKALAGDAYRELILCRLLSAPDALTGAIRELHARRDELLAAGARARAAAFTSPDPGADIVRLTGAPDVELALLTASEPELAELPGGDLGTVLESAPCDVGLLAGALPATQEAGVILVPFSGAEHDWTAIEVGALIARASGSQLVLAGAASGRRRTRDSSRLLANASLVVQAVSGVAAEPSLVSGGAAGFVEAGRDAALVVVGLSERWRREGVGEARLALVRDTGAPVLLIRRGLRPGGLTPPEGLTRFTWTLATRA